MEAFLRKVFSTRPYGFYINGDFDRLFIPNQLLMTFREDTLEALLLKDFLKRTYGFYINGGFDIF